MKPKFYLTVLTVFILLTASFINAFAADEWGMFRRDQQRTGVTDPSVLQANRLRPIWIYPVPASSAAPVDNDYGAVNEPNFVADPMGINPLQWKESSANVADRAPNAYNDNYLYIEASYSEEEQNEAWYAGATPKPSAAWSLDASAAVSSASYYISVWFPSYALQEYPFSRVIDAHYIVEDIVKDALGNIISRTVIGRFTLDQTYGESWVNLGTDPFEAKAGHYLVVTLTNETQNSSTAPQRIVIADAVKFVQDTGTILSSPVLSQSTSVNPILLSSPIYTKPLDSVTGQDSTRDVGIVNGINTENDLGTPLDDRGLRNWTFPANLDNWIQNGISSTPAITTYNAEEVAVVPASDGQVYVIRTDPAAANRLVWQGPGYTINDPTDIAGAGWLPVVGEPGYQGTGFSRATATPNLLSTEYAEWEQTGITAGNYSIFAWIPPSTTANPLYNNVNYQVTIGAGLPSNLFISQRNGGQWVRLGSSYTIPANGTVTVRLNNKYGPVAGQPAQYIAADAIKIIPSDLLSFELSSPVIDNSGDIYVGGENGRLYKLRIGQQNPVWVYPDPNASPSITDPLNSRYPAPNSVGDFLASPALNAAQDTVYIGSLDGCVYAINTDDGTRKWRFPDASNLNINLGEITSTTAVGNHIYVAIGGVGNGGNVYPYDTSGRVVALRDNGNNATAVWWSPSSPVTTPDNYGEFMYSSPLLLTRPGDADPSLYLGSTDGYFYGMNATDGTDLPNRYDGLLTWRPTDLLDIVNSSPAGTILPPGFIRRGTMAPAVDFVPYAFVGSDNNAFYGIDLRDGYKDWFWNMFSYVFASPAVAKERVYAADMAGFTWAFTSRPGGAAVGGEDWNTDTGITEAPTGGSETGDTDNSLIDMDIFTEANKDAWDMSATPHATSVNDTDNIYEWGESIHFVVWGIKSPVSKVQVSLKNRGGGRASNAGSEPITIPASAIQATVFNGDTVYYAKYQYVLDGANSGRTVTPGERVTLTAVEFATVNGTEQQIGTVFVPNKATGATNDKTQYEPRFLRVNNPLGFLYDDDKNWEDYQAGVTVTGTTSKDAAMAAMNGNFFDPATRQIKLGPFIRANDGTAHGTVSTPETLVVMDRSLMGAFGRNIGKFRVDFTDFGWAPGFVLDTLLPWEMAPVFGPWNRSTDYPNILEGQGIARSTMTGIDPSKISMGLNGTDRIASGNVPNTWDAGRNPIQFSVSVPRFQPANFGDFQNNDSLKSTGYTGRVRVFIDSNNNGRYDSAWGQGAQALRRRGRAGATNRTEAFREFLLQAHVLPDRHIEIAEKTIDIGQVAHGFGLVKDDLDPANNMPVSFYSNLTDNLADWDPANDIYGFNEWFKEFTAYNQGNVNLLNLKAYQPYLTSDTVSDMYSIRGAINDTGAAIPAGSRLPGAHTVTSLDALFLDDGPGIEPLYNLPSRTFHKAKVGDSESTLKIPDIPSNIYDTTYRNIYAVPSGDSIPAQQSPKLSISIPVGQPAGTYYGKFTLFDDRNNNGVYDTGESIGDPNINVTLNVSENRMTAGTMRGVIPSIDTDNVNSPNTGDMNPVAYRDKASGNINMFWSSNRYGQDNTGRVDAQPNPTDPWYLYISSLPWNQANGNWEFKVNNVLPDTSWWTPTGPQGTANAATPFPVSAYLASDAAGSFFPEPTAAIPNLGLPGATVVDTVKFYSPSIAQDPLSNRAWAFFLGQAYKDGSSSPETRSYVTEITGENISADNVFDTDRPTPNSNRNIDGDWSTPKYGFKGLATHMLRADPDPDDNLFLWTFWHGGSNGKWRIYYNANISPDGNNGIDGNDNWTNNATLPMPNGLLYMAEPAPFYRGNVYWDPDNNSPYVDFLDMVYSGYSTFHKNSDIYLSRYQPDTQPDARTKSLKMYANSAWRLPMRGSEYFFDEAGDEWHDKTDNSAGYVPFTKLNRSPTSAVWYSNDTDWDPLAGFKVMVFMNVNTGQLSNWNWYDLTAQNGVRDPKTGTWVYNFVKDQTLRQLFRGIIVDPAAGTVKFLRSPGKYAQVVASYTPRAYRLTTDTIADDSPFVIMDRDGNTEYRLGNPAGNPFHVPSGWDADVRPDTDRLWVFWRRPGIGKPGTGIHYKTYRYGIKLASQIAVDENTLAPQLISINSLPVADGGWQINSPVQIDWGRNNLYFSSDDEGNMVEVSYRDKDNQTVDILAKVELIEELGPSKEGSTFGNLTQTMVNEGQISAFKDRVEDNANNILEDRIWVFWTSTRSGNTDIYYEAISPRFYGISY